MTAGNLKYAERAYISKQIRMAQTRLTAINAELTRRGHDPRLVAESEILTLQLASLRVELEGKE